MSLPLAPTNEELVRSCILSPWEQRLLKEGCLASTVLCLAAVASIWWFASLASFNLSVWLLIPLALFAAGAAYSSLRRLVKRRTAPQFAVLRHRLGQGSFADYITEAKERLRSQSDLDRVILLQGGAPLPGIYQWVAIDLRKCNNHADSVQSRIGPHLWWEDVQADLLKKFHFTKLKLDQQSSDSLRELLGAENTRLASIPNTCIDGYHCRVAIVSNRAVTQAEGALGGSPEKGARQTTERLIQLVSGVGLPDIFKMAPDSQHKDFGE